MAAIFKSGLTILVLKIAPAARIIWLVLAAITLTSLATAETMQRDQPVDADPFPILFTVLRQSVWAEEALPGEVVEYLSPLTAAHLSYHQPHIDAGEGSIGFTLSLPLEAELEGNWINDRLYLSCLSMTLAGVEEMDKEIRDSFFPKDVLVKAQLTKENRELFPDPAKPVFVRRCSWVVEPRNPQEFRKRYHSGRLGSSVLMGRCADAIQRRFAGMGSGPVYDLTDHAVTLTRIFQGVDGNGELLGARCRQLLHPSASMKLASWYVVHHKAVE